MNRIAPLVSLAALALAAQPVLAQNRERLDSAPPSTATRAAASEQRLAWTGERVQAGVTIGRPAAPEVEQQIRGDEVLSVRHSPRAQADELLRALAAAEIAFESTREAEVARARLDELWLRAADERPYAGQREVLVEVARQRAQLLGRLGLRERALEAAQHLLPRADELAGLVGFAMTPAPAALVALEAEALEAPELVELRARFAPQAAGAKAADSIDELVRKAWDKLDLITITKLGRRAIPALSAMVEANVEFYSAERDPLKFIAKADSASAADLVTRLDARGGELWRKRVLDVMREAGILVGQEQWIENAPGVEPRARPQQPVWIRFLERNIDVPGFLSEAEFALRSAVISDGLTPKLQQALAQAARGEDKQLATLVGGIVDSRKSAPSVRPVLLAMLDSPHASVRASAANILRNQGEVEALLAHGNDSSEDVRYWVAEVLRQHTEGKGSDARVVPTEIGARERPVVEALARDPSAKVRATIAALLAWNTKAAVDPALLRTLAADPDSGVREVLLNTAGDLDRIAPVLRVMADSTDAGALQKLDERVISLVLNVQPGAVPVALKHAGVVELILARLRNPIGTPIATWRNNSSALKALMREPRVLAGLVERGASSAGEVGVLVVQLAGELDDREDAVTLDGVPSAALRDMVVAAASAGDRSVDEALPRLLRNAGKPLADVLAPVVADAQAELRARRACVGSLLAFGDAAALEAGLAFGREASWSQSEPGAADVRAMNFVLSRSKAERRAELTRALLGDARVQRPFVELVLTGYNSSGVPFPSELAPQLLRFPGKGADWLRARQDALYALRAPLAESELALLRELASDTSVNFAWATCLGRARDARLLPLLRQAIESLPANASASEGSYALALVGAIANYMNDDAVGILLDTAARSAGLRDECLKALATIRTYQDEKARWEGRASSEQARLASLAELLPMLEDKDEKLRAGAASSIATLGGVEHLARLVRLLQDKSPLVREAAQKAIDRLAAGSGK